ncbi:MAG TPA: helix-turn-helix domain-containing protein [Chloroflexota bacterium]|nr:helix-turn-helix domain-containing protein [Chloroflexota bacterium]
MNELTAALIEALGGRVAEPVAVPDPPPPPPQIDRRLEAKLAYTIPEAGELLGLCRASVYKLIASGELSTVNLSERAPRILRQELEEFLQRKANAARDRRAMVAATLRPRSLRSQ